MQNGAKMIKRCKEQKTIPQIQASNACRPQPVDCILKPVDWIMKHVDRNFVLHGNMSTGSCSRVLTCQQDDLFTLKPVDNIAAELPAEAKTEQPRNIAQSNELFNIFQSRKNFAMRSTEKL